MIVPTVLATTARRSCTLCCASDRPVAEDIAIPVTSLVALSFRTKPIGHCSGSLMLSAVAAGKQGPRNHRAGNFDSCLPPTWLTPPPPGRASSYSSYKGRERAGCCPPRYRLGL